MHDKFVGLSQAADLIFRTIKPLKPTQLAIWQCLYHVLAQDLYAVVDSPSMNVSLKDGYAVSSRDIEQASEQNPVVLKLLSKPVFAGDLADQKIQPGYVVRITTGAPLPSGADAVLAEEFVKIQDPESIIALNHAEPGRNVLPRGSDISKEQFLLPAGTSLGPAQIGLLAAAGHFRLRVIPNPKVAIIATGTEIISPGSKLSPGKLYASNLITLHGWCSHYRMQSSAEVLPDDEEMIIKKITDYLKNHDVLITCGGAWSGDKDLVLSALQGLNWKQIFHKVKIGPGKGAGFGTVKGKPVFALPGGPPSNLIAFFQLALPGLLSMSGYKVPHLPERTAFLTEKLQGKKDWTQFIFGKLKNESGKYFFYPLQLKSRLLSMARANALLAIPEGKEEIAAKGSITVQIIDQELLKD